MNVLRNELIERIKKIRRAYRGDVLIPMFDALIADIESGKLRTRPCAPRDMAAQMRQAAEREREHVDHA